MDRILKTLKALAEPTRLRIMYICSQSELTVGDIAIVLGVSQPRISKHLRVLHDSGLLKKYAEGNCVFYRTNQSQESDALWNLVMASLENEGGVLAYDSKRLQQLRETRTADVQAHFDRLAPEWDELRALAIDEALIDEQLVLIAREVKPKTLLDVGTGTGSILKTLAPNVGAAIGVDISRGMVDLARARIQSLGLENCLVRLGDMQQLELSDASVDMATVHLVLHYSHEPIKVLSECARVLSPGGLLVVVDFEKHGYETLRDEMNHRWLGFSSSEIDCWMCQIGLTPRTPVTIAGRHGPQNKELTVRLWSAVKNDPSSVTGD